MDIHRNSAAWYRLFCRVVCPGMIVLGLFLLAISYRNSQFTCQRASGQCAITHPGLLPAPKITFELGYLGRVLLEETDRCCSSDNPVWYNLTLEAGGIKKSYRLLYAWVNWRTVDALLKPAADQIIQFKNDPTIPEVTIRLPDNRREDLYCGVYFLVVGLVYTLINARVIFPWGRVARPEIRSEEIDPEPGSGPTETVEVPSGSQFENAPKKKRWWGPVRTWLWWSIVPWVGVFLCLQAIWGLYILMSRFTEPWRGVNEFPLLVDQILYYIEIFCPPLVYFTVQAWAIRRLGMNGFRWIAARMSSVLLLYILWGIWYRFLYQENFFSRAYSQGRLSIAGLLIGSYIGLFEAHILRSRVAHSSWWILCSALTGEILIVIPMFVIALFPQVQPLVNAINNSYLSLSPLFLFSAIRGAILIWMVFKTPATKSVETPLKLRPRGAIYTSSRS